MTGLPFVQFIRRPPNAYQDPEQVDKNSFPNSKLKLMHKVNQKNTKHIKPEMRKSSGKRILDIWCQSYLLIANGTVTNLRWNKGFRLEQAFNKYTIYCTILLVDYVAGIFNMDSVLEVILPSEAHSLNSVEFSS